MLFFISGKTATSVAATKAAVMTGLLFASAPAFATTWYVDGVYGHSSNPGTSSRPFQSFDQAENAARPGDTIYVRPSKTYSTLFITKSGTASAPITVQGSGGSSNPTRVSGYYNNFGVWLNASYVKLEYFNITAPGPYSGLHVPQGRHHDVISHNVVQNAGGDGIDLIGTDYMTISSNVVYGNARNVQASYGSGISIKGSSDIDHNTGTKMVVMNNMVYNNSNTAACGSCQDSDGSGIILDNNRREDLDHVWYRGQFFIGNNVVFGNGGRGIHLYRSDNIIVDGNSTYANNQDSHEGNWRPGEITGDQVSHVSVYNNIFYSDGGKGMYNGLHTGTHVPISFEQCTPAYGPIDIGYNLGYRPQNDSSSFIYTMGNSIPVNLTGNVWGDPRYANASLNPSSISLRPKSGSPALRRGASSWATSADYLGDRRYAPVTIGAYENAAN